MTDYWRVQLPDAIRPPFEVYINGVPQTEGSDYELCGSELLFTRELVQEGKLGFWRWLIGAFGIGTYRKNDTVDIRYERDGAPAVAHGLKVEPPSGQTRTNS